MELFFNGQVSFDDEMSQLGFITFSMITDESVEKKEKKINKRLKRSSNKSDKRQRINFL